MRRLLPIILISISLCFLPSSGISDDRDKYLSQWLELLKNGNSKEKQLALQNLSLLRYEEYRKDPRVLDPIFAALKDKDPLVREAAAAYWTQMTGPLGLSMTKADIPAHLIPLLEDEVPAVRAEAAKAASSIKGYATQQLVDALIKSFHDKDIWVRVNAVYALGELGFRHWSVTATTKQERFQQNSGGNVRKKERRNDILPPPDQTSSAEVQKMKRGIVTSSVGQTVNATVRKQELTGDVIPSGDESPSGRERRKAPLKHLIESPIQTGAKRELLAGSPHLNLKGAIAPMIELLGQSGDWREVFVKQEVVYAFAKMHVQGEKAIDALLQQYEQAYLKKSIIKTLGTLEALQAEKTLLKSLDENNEGIRNVALEALLQLPIEWEERNREKIIQDCRDKLNSPYPEVRTYAVKVLGKWDRKAGEVLILQALRDKSEKVMRAAIEELGNTESDKFLSDILPYFGQSSKTIRDASVRAFHQLALRTTNERVYAERKGTARIILKIDDGLPRENEHLLHRTASGMLVSELAKGDTPGKISALSIIDEFEDERIEPQLLRLLDDKVPDIRNRASYLLQEYGTEQSVPGLIKALKTSDRTLKLNVILALGVIGDDRAKKPLMELRIDNDERVRSAAVEALTKYCDPDYLHDNDPKLRGAALRCLEQRGNTNVYEIALAELVARKSQPQMIAAMDVISKTRDPRAIEPLIIILKEEDIHVAGKAARLLGVIGDRRAVEPLMDKLVYLDSLGSNYADNGMKYDLIEALTKIGDRRAVPVLIQMLKSDSAGVVDKAIYALQEFKDSRAVPALISVSNRRMNTWTFVQSSTRALGKIGSPEALDHLEKLLYEYNKKDKVGYVRGDITCAIGDIKSEKTIALVTRYLDSSEFLLGDVPWIMDILIKNNHKSPTTIRSLVRISGKTQRAFCDSFVLKFNNLSEDPENPKDIANIVLTTLKEDNNDSKVGGIRIGGYFIRYKRIKDQFIMKSLMESLNNLKMDNDSRVQSEAALEMKLIETSLSKNVK